MKEPCTHCWHYAKGYSNGLGSAGEDDYRCCFCGVMRSRKWVGIQGPKHGPHQQNGLIKRYDDER